MSVAVQITTGDLSGKRRCRIGDDIRDEEDRTAVIKLKDLSHEEVREIASQIADAFYDYKYSDETSLYRMQPLNL